MEELSRFLGSLPSWLRVVLLAASLLLLNSWVQRLMDSLQCDWQPRKEAASRHVSPSWKASAMMYTSPRIYLLQRKRDE